MSPQEQIVLGAMKRTKKWMTKAEIAIRAPGLACTSYGPVLWFLRKKKLIEKRADGSRLQYRVAR